MRKFNKNLFYIFLTFFVIGIINKLIFLFSSMKSNVYTSSGHYYQWKFGKIFYTVQGYGKPLLLISSLYNGSSETEYYKLINKLSKKHKVYTIDLIGYGKSDKLNMTYTAFLYVQLISDFINDVIKEPANIISTSSSCAFVTMACYQNPDLFNKLLLINPLKTTLLTKNPTKKDQVIKYLLETPILGTTVYNLKHSRGCIKKQLTKAFYNKNKVKNKYINNLYEASHLNGVNNKYVYASQKCKYLNVNINNALENVNNSIYIAIGEFYNNEVIEDYLTKNPSIEYSIITNAKVLPQLENPKEIIEICNIYFI